MNTEKIIFSLQIFLLSLILFTLIGCSEDSDDVVLTPEDERTGLIPDPSLEAAIRKAIDKPQGTITKGDLKEVTELDAGAVKDLTGLEYCTNLRKLRIGGPTTDLSPLSGLVNLQSLSLSTGTDISPLSSLINLQKLALEIPKISDLLALEKLVNLRSLTLGLPRESYSDISGLEGLTNLRYLDIRSGKVKDLSPLSSLVSLEDLWLRSYPIRDISFLSGLKKLQLLAIPCNEISDISPLSKLTSLRNIDLSINKITDMSPLVDNPGIDRGDYVYLEGNPLSEESISIYIPILEERGVNVYF